MTGTPLEEPRMDSTASKTGFHHHPAPTAVGHVIGGVMFVARPVTDVVQAYIDQSALAGALKNTGFKIGGEDFRQEGEDLELHDWILA
jgi:hypothetical protein